MKTTLATLLVIASLYCAAQPIVTYNTPLTFCQGDSVKLYASGYTNVYWLPNGQTTDSIVVYTEGQYGFIANYGTPNAETSNTVIITVNPLPQDQIIGDYIICGGCVGISAPPGYAHYLWSNGDTTESTCCNSSCDVYITNEFGCSAYGGGYSIIDWGTPPPITIVLNGPRLEVLNGSSNVYYHWIHNGTPIANWSNYWYLPTENGTYIVYVNHPWCSPNYSNVFTLTNVGVDEVAGGQISIYPNPVEDWLYIDNNPGEEMIITLYNTVGQTVLQTIQSNQKRIEIPLNELKSGIYWLKIEQNGKVYYKKVVKGKG